MIKLIPTPANDRQYISELNNSQRLCYFQKLYSNILSHLNPVRIACYLLRELHYPEI